MNLEALVDRLNDSKSREFANQIFAQMDIVDNAYEELEEIKESHKVNFEKLSAPLVTKRETYIALNIGFSKDYKASIRDHKLQAKAQIKEIKSDTKIELKQLKSEIGKFEERLDSYYTHHKKEYELAIKNNVAGAQAKFDKFEKDFKEFKQEQMQKIAKSNEEKISLLLETANKQISEIEIGLQEYVKK